MDMAAVRLERSGATAVTAPAEFGLTPLDWRVVALARHEADRFGAAAFRARGRLARAWDRFVGMEGGVRRLADDRLEAVRRFVGLTRRGDREAAAAAALLATLGLCTPAIELLRAVAAR